MPFGSGHSLGCAIIGVPPWLWETRRPDGGAVIFLIRGQSNSVSLKDVFGLLFFGLAMPTWHWDCLPLL